MNSTEASGVSINLPRATTCDGASARDGPPGEVDRHRREGGVGPAADALGVWPVEGPPGEELRGHASVLGRVRNCDNLSRRLRIALAQLDEELASLPNLSEATRVAHRAALNSSWITKGHAETSIDQAHDSPHPRDVQSGQRFDERVQARCWIVISFVSYTGHDK